MISAVAVTGAEGHARGVVVSVAMTTACAVVDLIGDAGFSPPAKSTPTPLPAPAP